MFPPAHGPDSEKAATYYERYFEFLFDIATARFHIPPDRAEDLADEILLCSLRHLPTISDPDSWLLGAITTAAKRETVV